MTQHNTAYRGNLKRSRLHNHLNLSELFETHHRQAPQQYHDKLSLNTPASDLLQVTGNEEAIQVVLKFGGLTQTSVDMSSEEVASLW